MSAIDCGSRAPDGVRSPTEQCSHLPRGALLVLEASSQARGRFRYMTGRNPEADDFIPCALDRDSKGRSRLLCAPSRRSEAHAYEVWPSAGANGVPPGPPARLASSRMSLFGMPTRIRQCHDANHATRAVDTFRMSSMLRGPRDRERADRGIVNAKIGASSTKEG